MRVRLNGAAVSMIPAAFAVGILAMHPVTGRSAEAEKRGATLRVFASIPPIAYLADRIGNGFVRVEVLVKPGQEPHSFELTPRQMARLSDADLFLAVGFPFERRLAEKTKGVARNIEIVDVTRGIPRRFMESAHHHHHGHEGRGRRAGVDHHDSREPDPHVWLSPRNAMQIAANIADAFCRRDRQHEQAYRANLAALNKDLADLDAAIRHALAPVHGQSIFVFHPAFGYFADAYGLKQVPVEMEGKEPTARRLAELIESARHSGVHVIFVQPQFSTRTAQVIARAIDGAVVPLDPLAYDYIANLRDMTEKVRRALQESR